MAKNIVTLNLDNTDYSLRPYSTCSTAAATAAKTVSITGFTLCSGATILVKFLNSNAIVAPTLNVNGTGDKPITHQGHRFDPNIYYEFIYNGSSWVQIGEEKHRCSVSSGNKNNYPWHRIAYTDVLTTQYVRRTVSLILNQAVFGGKYGELVIKVNTNSTNTNSSYEVYWVVNKGFGVDDIKIGVNNTYGNTYFDVFYKCPGTWSNLLIEQKTGGYDSNFTKSFTLCSSQEVSDTTTTDRLTSYECYATIESAATELHNTAYTTIISPNTSSGTLGKISFNGDLTGNAATATNADKLDNHDSTYFATKDDVKDVGKVTSVDNHYKGSLGAKSSGLYKVAIDEAGHITGATAVAKSDITELGIPGTAYSHPTNGANTSVGPSANASPSHGGTFTVPYITVNNLGHVTAASNKTITLPNITQEAYLTWGGRSLAASLSPVDVATDGQWSTNRLSFMPASGIQVEYSTNGGTSWTDYGLTDVQKQSLVTTGLSQTLYMGNNSTNQSVNDMLRVTITAESGKTYFSLKKIYAYLSTNGANSTMVKIEKAMNGSDTTFVHVGEYPVSGWSGWNSIPLVASFGGGDNQTGNIRRIRMTFYFTAYGKDYGPDATNKVKFYITNIQMIGETSWSNSGGNLSKTGHMYSWDINKNVTFPAGVTTTSTLTVKGNTTLGDAISDTVSIKGPTTLDSTLTVKGKIHGDFADSKIATATEIQNLFSK